MDDIEKLKVLVIGEVYGSYRAQSLIRGLLEHQSEYVFSRASRAFYSEKQSCENCTFLTKAKIWINNVFLRALTPFFFLLEISVKALFADIIYLLPMNLRLFPHVYFFKVIYQKPLIIDLYISIYDTVIDTGKVEELGFLSHWFYSHLDRWGITKSDLLIHHSWCELEHIANLVGVNDINEEKVRILPLAVEPRSLADLTPSAGEIFRVCWWGSLIPLHGLDKMIRAIGVLVKENFPIRFDIFAMPSSKIQSYLKLVASLELENAVEIHVDKTFINGKLEPYLVHQCDLALGVFGDSSKAQNAIVNKVVDALALQLPVLTRPSPAINEFLNPETDLFVCESTPKAIADAVRAIANDPEERKRRAYAGHSRYLSTFTITRYIQEVLSCLKSFSG